MRELTPKEVSQAREVGTRVARAMLDEDDWVTKGGERRVSCFLRGGGVCKHTTFFMSFGTGWCAEKCEVFRARTQGSSSG